MCCCVLVCFCYDLSPCCILLLASCSCAGYLAIALLGQQLGLVVRRPAAGRDDKAAAAGGGPGRTSPGSLLGSTALLWVVVFTLIYAADLPISRRLANASYVAFTAAYSMSSICMLYLGHITLKMALPQQNLLNGKEEETATPLICRAVNRNQLAIFLIANVMTGAVNASMKTLYSSDLTALCVLSGYMFTVCLVAVLLDHYSVTLKFWGSSSAAKKRND